MSNVPPRSSASPLIRLENIHKAYQMGPDLVPVLKGVDLSVKEGEFVAIMGASGSGKSTLLHLAGALDTPDPAEIGIDKGGGKNGAEVLPYEAKRGRSIGSGEVYFRDKALSAMGRKGRHRLRNLQFGFVFQFYHLLPELNVLENVLLPGMIEPTPRWLVFGLFGPAILLVVAGLGVMIGGAVSHVGRVWLGGEISFAAGLAVLVLTGLGVLAWTLYKLFVRENPKRGEALALLESFGLSKRLKHRPAQLSGGERQRVAIARALVNKPALLLADEPTGNLDAKTGRSILDVLVKLHKERGQTILLVTHDPLVAGLADRIVRLEEGRIKVG